MIDIGKVAALSGVPASTLRYYEEKGLIYSSGRKGLRRQFDNKVLEQLDFIALARVADFSLDEIAAMFTGKGEYQVNREQLVIKANELESRIKQLIAVRDGLQHAAVCQASSHKACPKFQKLLRLAGKHQAKMKSAK